MSSGVVGSNSGCTRSAGDRETAIFDAMARVPRRSRGAGVFDAASVGLAASFAALLLSGLARALHAPSDMLAVAAAAPVGLLVADLVSALVHWFCDTFFDSKTPLLGAIIGPFRLHHHDPDAFRRHDVCERNRNNCLAALPLLALAQCLTPRLAATGHPFLGALLAVVAIALAGATQIHAWAHDRDPPRLVQWLQRCGVLLSRERHARHHREAHDRCYGIVNGWVNGALDRTGFFRRGSGAP